jgi:hypothetical protein
MGYVHKPLPPRNSQGQLGLPSVRVGRPARASWSEDLVPQGRVTVHQDWLVYEGTVDMVTDDRTMIWVVPVDLGQRRVFHVQDDVEIVLTTDPRS